MGEKVTKGVAKPDWALRRLYDLSTDDPSSTRLPLFSPTGTKSDRPRRGLSASALMLFTIQKHNQTRALYTSWISGAAPYRPWGRPRLLC
jgi:hypothetical protein